MMKAMFITIAVIGAAVLLLGGRQAPVPFDDTDPLGGGRSGLSIYTDAKTGVQYLGTQRGGLTVRVDQYGWPMLEGQDTTKGDER